MKVGDTVTVTAAPEGQENLVGATGTIQRETAIGGGGFMVQFQSGWRGLFRAHELAVVR